MNTKRLYIILISALMCCQAALAQEGGEMIRGKVVSERGEELVNATVLEIDAMGRFMTNTVTDMNGEFSMKIKNTKNKLQATYIGFKQLEVPIGTRREFQLTMKDENVIKEVVVTAKKMVSSPGMDIPAREVAFSMQSINTEAFKGMQVASIDDALQGHIAGLDIVGTGNVGTVTQMRLRGISSLNSVSAPLIVINGIQRPDIPTNDFDFAGATEQQLADLLLVNPEDIEEIQVLKDASATARYGSRGGSGVIEIITKRGKRGPTHLTYNYKFLGAQQPPGLKMLNGDDYTMLMKQARFNPTQSSNASDIKEFSYDPTWSEYRHYNNNTDWRKEIIQYGVTHQHDLTISGGGDRATFRFSGGYMTKAGTIIGNNWNRFTSRTLLDYHISERILVKTEVAFTYSDNDQNYANLLDIAYRKMPNMSVHYKDDNGRDLPNYYTMLPSSQLYGDGKDDAKTQNPVALARLATNNSKTYDVVPTMRLLYDFIERTTKKQLRYEGYVTFSMSNSQGHKFLPKEISPKDWTDGNINKVEDNDGESFSIQSENKLVFQPWLGDDHSFSGNLNFYTESGSSNSQGTTTHGYPSEAISVNYVPGYIDKVGSSIGQGRTLRASIYTHYAFRSKYILDFSLTGEGSTKFGKARKWGKNPSLSTRWNISDESFMKFSKDWLTLWGLKFGWGITGNQPGKEYMHFSIYKPSSSYMENSAIRPDNIRLADLRWERVNEYNIGTELQLWDGKYTADVNYYNKRTDDLLFPDAPLPGSTGYDKLNYRNVGSMRNMGYELNLHANRFIKIGNFTMDAYFNSANSVNAMIYLDPDILANKNGNNLYDFNNRNAGYMQHWEPGHAYGSIYGFRYKGVYQYSIDNPALIASNYTLGTSPVARDANGQIIFDSKGKPLPMYYCYGAQGVNPPYMFQGGDAIYEDVNHDGQIDQEDIVYLGNSNPKLNGGFGFTFRWKSLTCNAYFVYRYGQKIINQARRNAESMLGDNNQSIATNYRWRREGDQKIMPRALYNAGWNSLPSDRYVEDGSFTRLKNLTFNYTVSPEWVRKYYLTNMTLSLNFNNILTFTKYQGVDAEVGNIGVMGQSVDNSITPRSKDVTLGLSVTF